MFVCPTTSNLLTLLAMLVTPYLAGYDCALTLLAMVVLPYLAGYGGALKEVGRPQELGADGDGRETERDAAPGVERGVQTVVVSVDMLTDFVVPQRQQHGETTKAEEKQQRCFILFQRRFYAVERKNSINVFCL
jgi:hypothetical protein